MILTVLNNKNQGGGGAAVDYVLSKYDHKGDLRDPCAQMLFGDPCLTKSIIDGLPFKHKYLSLSFNFRDSEKFDSKMFCEILERFHSAVFPGLGFERLNYLAVSHGSHVHVIIPKVDLLTGKSCNGHPPTLENKKLWNLFVRCVNYENGWKQVDSDTSPVRLKQHKFPSGRFELKSQINSQLIDLYTRGIVNSKVDVVNQMEKWGFVVARNGSNYISVRVPGNDVALRFKGGIFRDDFGSRLMGEFEAVNGFLTKNGYDCVNSLLSGLIENRKIFNEVRFVNKKLNGGVYGCAVNRVREICNKSQQELSAADFKSGRFSGVISNTVKSNNDFDNKIKQLSADAGRTSATLLKTGSASRKSGLFSQAGSDKGYCPVEGVSGDIYSVDMDIASVVGQIAVAKSLNEKSNLQNKLNSLLGKKEKLLAKIQLDKQNSILRI